MSDGLRETRIDGLLGEGVATTLSGENPATTREQLALDGDHQRDRLDRRIFAWVSTVLVTGQILCLLGSIALTIIQVIYRYVLRSTPVWLEQVPDVLTILFSWLIFLGVPRAVLQDSAVRVGSSRLYPRRWRSGIGFASTGAMIVFFGLLTDSYLRSFQNQIHTHLTSLTVPSYVATGPILIGSVVALLFLVWRLAVSLRSIDQLAGFAVGAAIPAVTVFLTFPPTVVAPLDVVLLLLLDCPVAVALGIGGAAAIVNGIPGQVSIVASQVAVPTANIALLAIPMFLFMGTLFSHSSLSRGLGNFVRALLGWLPGGVGVATIGTSALFANITGSAVADTAAIGTIYVPEMIEAGYPAEDAAALQGAAGVIGVIFPPSVAMILFASVAAVNVEMVFKAVIIPGLLIAAVLMAVAVAVAHRRRIANPQQFQLRRLIRSVPRAIPVLLIPLILDGGIFSGVFSPAESGAVAIIVVLVMAVLLGGARPRDIARAAAQAMDNTTLVVFILTSVSLLDYAFVVSGVQADLTRLLNSVGHSPLAVLVVINLIFIIAHEFIDAGPAIVVLIPLVLPAVLAAGVNPFQLAAVVAVNSSIGAILPPVGIPVYVAARLAGVPAMRVFRRVVPYVLASTVVLILVTTIPAISLTLGSS